MEIFEADHSHEADLRALMRTIKVPGPIELIYTREPDFFHGLETQGHFNQIAIVKKNDEIAGMGYRSIRPMYINGVARDFGYLGGLRAVARLRGGITKMIFNGLYSVHKNGNIPAYITTVIEQNNDAINALLRHREGMPYYHDLGRCFFHAINFTRRRKAHVHREGMQIIRGNQIGLEKVIQFLNDEGRHRHFFPVFSMHDFQSPLMRNFSIDNFYIALKHGEIAGIIGKWDQHAFKQIIVSDYRGSLKMFRPFINAALVAAGYKPFPERGEPIKIFYVSFICIINNDTEILRALLDRLYQDNKNSCYHYMLVGFHENDPLRNTIKGYFCYTYISRLYIVSWSEHDAFTNSLRPDMVPYIETAIL